MSSSHFNFMFTLKNERFNFLKFYETIITNVSEKIFSSTTSKDYPYIYTYQ